MGSKFESNTQKSKWDSSRNIMQESEQTQLEEESKENVWKKIYYDKKEIHQEEKLNYLKDHFGQRTEMPYSAKKKGKKEEQRLPEEYLLDPGIQVGIEKDIKESEKKIGKNDKIREDFWSLIEEIKSFTQTGGSQEEKNSGKEYFKEELKIREGIIRKTRYNSELERFRGPQYVEDLKKEDEISLDLIQKILEKLGESSILPAQERYFFDAGIQDKIKKEIEDAEKEKILNNEQKGLGSLMKEIEFFFKTGGTKKEKENGKKEFIKKLKAKQKRLAKDKASSRQKDGKYFGDQDPTVIETKADKSGKLIEKISTMLEEATMFSERGKLEVPEEKEECKEQGDFSFTYRVPLIKNFTIKKTARFVSREEKSLFEGIPKVADIHQGHVNDCYFLSALTTIVAKDPDYILKAMKDNANGTVTVRFYKEGKPVYVTVKKEVPVNIMGRDVGAQRSLWVQMMERAFAVFAARYEIESKTERPEGYQEGNSYNNIDFGTGDLAMKALLGEKIQENLCILGSGDPTIYDRIEKEMQSGNTVVPVTCEAERHVYTVLGCEMRGEQKYIRVRNPYGNEHYFSGAKKEKVREMIKAEDIIKEKDGIFLMKEACFDQKFSGEVLEFTNQ